MEAEVSLPYSKENGIGNHETENSKFAFLIDIRMNQVE
jgi:hypothetical protein